MDGTLIRSHYDWPGIRAELGVDGPSLIDALNELPAGRRSAAWARMCEIEKLASLAATVVDGAAELLDLLAGRGIKRALVTNNSSANALDLVDRFALRFDEIITRDSGLYKPSGAPLVEAMRRLETDPSRVMAVGDSMYDIQAAREAGCAWVVLVNGGACRHPEQADLAFRNLTDLGRFLLTEGYEEDVVAAASTCRTAGSTARRRR